MSAGSDASNLGYGKIFPNSNVNPNYVNVDNSHYPGGFGSNEIPGLPGLAGAKSNIDAAASRVPGICLMKGGSKKLKRKIKNITKQYKMKGGKKSLNRKFKKIGNNLKKSFANLAAKAKSLSKSMSRSVALAGGRRTRRRRAIRGGYSQYQNNLPMTPTYSVGGILGAKELGLANPPPISVLPNCTNCVDGYNHFTGKGSSSFGH